MTVISATLRRLGLGGQWFKASSGRRLARPPSQLISQVAHTCNPSYTGGTGRRIQV
jgi:hypothetical protein